MSEPTLLEVKDLVKLFDVQRGFLRRKVGAVRAVDGLSLTVEKGETVALVGESGCGKSTVGRVLVRLADPTGGQVLYRGTDITALKGRALKPFRRRVQIMFQDPFSSLNPRLRVRDIVAEPLVVHGIGNRAARQAKVAELLDQVGLSPDRMGAHAHEFSGGQRQRIGLARALALGPDLIVADEPLSALDVSVQAQVVNLMAELQAKLGLAFLLISHDLAVVEHLSRRVAVMYLGKIVETAPTRLLFSAPRHPYTEALLDAAPVPDPHAGRADRPVIAGEVPSPLNPPAGCRFHPRCPLATDICRQQEPSLSPRDDGRSLACHHR